MLFSKQHLNMFCFGVNGAYAWEWGVLPYIGYIGMCGAKWYGFLAVLV